MARIEWVRHELENWARWAAEKGGGALGYPRQTAFARMVARGSAWDSGQVPTSSLRAELTDRAVKSLQLTRSHLYEVLTLHYAQGYEIHRVALKMCRAPSTVKRNLDDADHAIAAWFQDRQTKAAEVMRMMHST
jgi:DNA-directed RNA polymerase specialized sigma24 family protein